MALDEPDGEADRVHDVDGFQFLINRDLEERLRGSGEIQVDWVEYFDGTGSFRLNQGRSAC